MKPILYYYAMSPPSRAALMVVRELGLDVDLRSVNLFTGEHLTPEYVKMSPQHTVPLLDDNGVYITDSHAICEYLCSKYGKDDKLYPKDLVKRALISSRLHFDSCFIFARMRFLYEPVFFHGSKEVPQDRIENVLKVWDILEGFLQETPYLAGDDYTIADFCCVASATTVTDEVAIDPAKYPKITAWIKRMEQLPYFKELNQAGADEVRTQFAKKLEENRAK